MTKIDDAHTVLLLEDDDIDASITRKLLEKSGASIFHVHRCKYLAEAVAMLSRHEFPIALVDMNVPDSSGLDTVSDVLSANPNTPIVVLTGTDDNEIAIQAVELGAQDYLPKASLESRALERIIHHAIRRKTKENELTAKAYYDCLTGVANRTLMHDRWSQSIKRAHRAELCTGALIIDVDRFKEINDEHGHNAGDGVLMDLAKRLKKLVRGTDIVARLGGDEFVIILENVRSKSEIDRVRDNLMTEIRYFATVDDRNIPYTISIGGALAEPGDEGDLMATLRRADVEMYKFKAQFKRRHEVRGETIGRYRNFAAG